ncbi:MAG: PAS domain-containing protein [Proteobacteria bacterium]|nr:PAS domain-containing protein [Pseudomonadota bacterium]MBU4382541.1 PAS domain-containing protein [Pseudomonadota bacterium]MBU4606109.1 PAS domain-containing protein [Pseudomonadota bacterium]MCG2765058.1 PAS domain-containing protein [Desulfarculaceae bacterium]
MKTSRNSAEFAELRKHTAKLLLLQKATEGASLKRSPLDLIEDLEAFQNEIETQNEQLRQSQAELAAAKDKYQNLFELAPVGFISLEQNGAISEVNLTGAAMLGRERRHLIGVSIFQFASNEHQLALHDCLKSTGNTGKKRACEMELRPKQGAPRFLHVECMAQLDQWKRPAEYRLVMLEITERKESEARATQRNEQYRALVETITDWFWEVDQDGRYLHVSTKVKYFLGYDPEEIVGKTLFDLMPPAEADRVRPLFRMALDNQEPILHLEGTYLHKGGGRVVLETNGAPVIDGQGRCVGFRGMFALRPFNRQASV